MQVECFHSAFRKMVVLLLQRPYCGAVWELHTTEEARTGAKSIKLVQTSLIQRQNWSYELTGSQKETKTCLHS